MRSAIGMCRTRVLECLNPGPSPAYVLDVQVPVLEYAELSMTPLALPLTVAAGDSLEIEIELCGGSVQTSTGTATLVVTADQGQGSFDVELEVGFVVPY